MNKGAGLYRSLEKRHLRLFERIMVASEHEVAGIAPVAKGLPLEVWPNVVPAPPKKAMTAGHPGDGTWRILFIGSLGHFPNREAVHFAARNVLPCLQTLIPLRAVLVVAGAGADAHREEFAGLPHLEWRGTVGDIHSLYGEADMVLVPLHAGGGTRIKILEAFAHRKPVVSTPLGAEGLNVVDGRELLIAEDPAALAGACARLFREPGTRERLVMEGYDCWSTRFTPDSLSLLSRRLAREITGIPG
jgi:glycosyltransferase involved in cell wall biosynthesis